MKAWAWEAVTGRYTDADRHHLVVECEDWKAIPAALIEWSAMFLMAAEGRVPMASAINCHRVLVETIYVMGYERGKAERAMPTFLVAEEE